MAQLADYIHAAFTGLYLETQEPDEAAPRNPRPLSATRVVAGHLGHRPRD
ncbi:MAG: hypothetical protein U0872_07055 [Planctomycetaceae bacterium]